MTTRTLDDALSQAREMLGGGEAAATDAVVLLCGVLGIGRAALYAHPEHMLTADEEARARAALARRRAGEPVAHILGRREFWGLDLAVTADTLIPRPDTETLVERALAAAPADRACDVLDLGTGSGAIALAMARERPRWRVTGTDASAAALAVARANAERLGLTQVRWLAGDWYTPLETDARFDLIVSNPPYVAAGDPHLARGDVRFEPAAALVGGDDGLHALRKIVAGAAAHLRPGGALAVEHGFDQSDAVKALFARAGFAQIKATRDLAGQPRVVDGRLV